MGACDIISGIIDSPKEFIENNKKENFAAAGFLGYLTGAFSIFVFLRMFNLIPSGVFSLFILFSVFLCGNFLFAGIIHLFFELIDKKGDVLKLFFLSGVAEFFWSMLIPMGFIVKLNYFSVAFVFFLVFALVVMCRIIFARYLYHVGGLKAFVAISFPYIILSVGGFIVIGYGFVWLIWLIV